ncbi:MAG: hypothetical protein JWO67_967 [Streptosporangiaceae bacterium]|nr:hypothetical protein [Streptosporangiaceae bacterium]
MPDPGTGEARITFVGYRRPAVESGDYEITVEQNVTIERDGAARTETFSVSRGFTVAGERFALPPSAIRSVFPPAGSLGDHGNVLPHVILDRPTLPWERDPCPTGDDQPPWLALLLLTEDERREPQVITLGELTRGPAYFPTVTLEDHQSPDDPVTVIDLPAGLLTDLLPHYDDLGYLAHVRMGDGADAAVVVGSRPPPGPSSTVHLVSLEHRFRRAGSAQPVFDVGTGGPDSLVRLITLASWRFACVDKSQTFAAMVRGLAGDGGSLRLPDTGTPTADAFLGQGFVPVAHELRHGGRSVAWYRGPLLTGSADSGPVTPVRTADALLRFHPDMGMFDIGYAAAWQLGRLLALQSTDFAVTLYEWRRRRAQSARRAMAEPDGYPLAVTEIDDTLPSGVLNWLIQLARLESVPFGYLVPDERLLPAETIRFFGLDQDWLRYLVDGAYSIGRLSRYDADLDEAHPLPLDHPRITGALIRSDVVTGYPGLLVDGYADATTDHPLPQVRVEQLSDGVLICLFKGELARLDLHQRPESQHLAVENEAHGRFGKSLRAPGAGTGAAPPPLTGLSFGPRGTLPLAILTSAMAEAMRIGPADLSAGHFALQMTETAERIRFRLDEDVP